MGASWLQGAVARLDRTQQGVRGVRVAAAVAVKFGQDRGGDLAALIAYYGFLSLFPLLILVASAVAALHRPPDWIDVVLARFPVVGPEIGGAIQPLEHPGLAFAGAVLVTAWAGLAGLKASQVAMDRIWDVPVRRQPGLVRATLRACVMLGTLGVWVVASSALHGVSDLSPWPVRLGSAVGVGLLDACVFLAAYRILTVAEVTWREAIPGAVLAALGWGALQGIGTWFVTRQLDSATQRFGSFGIVVALLAWLLLAAHVFIIGAELNVVLARKLWPRSFGPATTPTDRRALRRHARFEERVPGERVDAAFVSERTAGEDSGPGG